jgi:hypothetical protein
VGAKSSAVYLNFSIGFTQRFTAPPAGGHW